VSVVTEKIDFKSFDKKWQERWKKEKIFEANPDPERKKFFINVPYPYVNGGPHIGHSFTNFRGDIYARFKRMQGFNVLYPQGFHATGEPIVGVVKRLKEKDKSQIDSLKMYGVKDKDIKDFVEKGPEYVAKFWKKKWIETLKASGFSIDWRRTFITTPITPTYSRFIEWQYNTLKEKGYVIQGTHPVVWCPSCISPTGDHDRLDGVGESPIEYVVIKFKLGSGEIIPCATLRPETIYGVTNIWIDPEVEYVRADVDGEKWIMSETSTKKFQDQLKTVEITGKIKGSEIVGKACENPVTKTQIPVLPAEFCDTEVATGIVMSVPSHAPYDWIGLVDLKADEEQLKKYGIKNIITSVEPISIISVKGFGEHPAGEMCEQLEITSQKDVEKLEKATGMLYKKEFHTGICKDNCGKYSGMKIAEAKEILVEDFTDEGYADIMWETTAPVVCRCKTRCYIKILENQWFLKFSDPQWKQRAHRCIDNMIFYPEDARQQFKNTVDWLRDKACTRKSGMGTPLPWDKTWIVETLSDSVIYMAYYTISKTINENKIKAEQLSDEVFDFIFLGKGNEEKLAEENKLNIKYLQEMREEFEYFYPFDLRTTGKDLVQNHMTFSIFHHVAIWDEDKWPHAFGVNGFVNVGGEKMSKSKGNFIPMSELIKTYGADITRINIAGSNENMDDADWREDSIQTYKSRISYLFGIINEMKKAKREDEKQIDIYIQSTLNKIIKDSTEHYQNMKYRSAVQLALFALTNEIKLYIDRADGIENCNKNILANVIESMVKMMAPVMPHFAEEMWKKMGNKTFVSIESWPEADENKINKDIMQLEEIYRKSIEDVKQVIKLSASKVKTPENLFLYFATAKELNYFNDSIEHLAKIGFGKVTIFLANDPNKHDPQDRAKRTKYGKPGIYLE